MVIDSPSNEYSFSYVNKFAKKAIDNLFTVDLNSRNTLLHVVRFTYNLLTLNSTKITYSFHAIEYQPLSTNNEEHIKYRNDNVSVIVT